MSEIIEAALWLVGTGIGCALSYRFMRWAEGHLGPRPD
jgi:hypothetical protein